MTKNPSKGLISRLSRAIARNMTDEMDQRIVNAVQSRLKKDLPGIVDGMLSEELEKRMLGIVDTILVSKLSTDYVRRSDLYLPNNVVAGSIDGGYMRASNALARDFLNPQFQEFCEKYHRDPPLHIMHRKLWEYAFIYHHLRAAGVLRPGMRGLGFGVGTEKLPAIFAGMGVEVTATDSLADTEGWRRSGQYADSLEALYFPDIVGREVFERMVRYRGCDMNHIADDLVEYDFCWSSCALEHLGSLQNGIDFVINSVEKTLRIGGIACHTTELNLSSDTETLETSVCVFYRKQDLARLLNALEERGHQVEPLRIEPGELPPDYLVDVPPYSNNPHLKILFGSYVTTSVGIVARRGR